MSQEDLLTSKPHAVLFPFMSKGHMIPMLNVARLLLSRNVSVTIVATPLNLPFISTSLMYTAAKFATIPFPLGIDQIPENIESTDKLPCMSLFLIFANATKLMKPAFDHLLASLPSIDFLVFDGFLSWANDSAEELKIPRIVTFGMSAFAGSIRHAYASILMDKMILKPDKLFESSSFPQIKLSYHDIIEPWNRENPAGLHMFNFITEVMNSSSKSHAIIFNSFYEPESPFVNYWANNCIPKPICLGPLCAAEPIKPRSKKPKYIEWLDQTKPKDSRVLYAAFGTQAALSETQLLELAKGLESSGERFIWVVKPIDLKKIEIWDMGFVARVKQRGLILSDWVNQREILSHVAVKGFMSHCGWNSVTESFTAGVPILAWPMMAEQHLNARFVVEVLGVGVRVESCDGSVRGFVKSEGVERSVKRLLGDKEVERRMREVKEMGVRALEEGGSSWRALNELIDDVCEKKSRVVCHED